MNEKKIPTLRWHHLLLEIAGGSGSNTRVVEIGAFQGQDTQQLESLGARVVAVDIDPSLLSSAVDNANIKSPLASDMLSLSLRDGSVDTVFFPNSIVFAEEKVGQALLEAARVVRPGGKVYICTDYMPTTQRPYKQIAISQTPGGMKNEIISCGLTVEKMTVVDIPEKPWTAGDPYLIVEARK